MPTRRIASQLVAPDNRCVCASCGQRERGWSRLLGRPGHSRRPPWPTPKPPVSTLRLRDGSTDLRPLVPRPRNQRAERQATAPRDVRPVDGTRKPNGIDDGTPLVDVVDVLQVLPDRGHRDKNPALNLQCPKVHDEKRTLGRALSTASSNRPARPHERSARQRYYERAIPSSQVARNTGSRAVAVGPGMSEVCDQPEPSIVTWGLGATCQHGESGQE